MVHGHDLPLYGNLNPIDKILIKNSDIYADIHPYIYIYIYDIGQNLR